MDVTLNTPETSLTSEEAEMEVFVAPASFSQERMWFLNELWPESPVYNVVVAMQIRGPLDVRQLQTALDRVVERHETLRTNFDMEEGQVVQLIHPERPIQLGRHDLSTLPPERQQAAATRLVERLIRTPFSLTNDPLLRVDWVSLSEQERILVVTCHHIISDEWSISVFFKELTAGLASTSQPAAAGLDELPIQYADYAVWQREQVNETRLQKQMNYWREQFKTPAPVLELPLDHPRPTIQSVNGSYLPFRLSSGLSTQLLEFCRSQRATPFITLTAAYAVLLQRFSGQQEFVVGCPIAHRNRPELEGLIGLFLNTILLRINLADDPSFGELVQRVRAASLGAFANQDIPFERLVEELRPERNTSHPPLFQTMVTVQNSPFEAPPFPGCTATLLDPNRGISRFDLALYVKQSGQELEGEFEYNTDLFEAASIARMAEHFQVLVEELTRQPAQPISQLPLLPASELQQQIFEWNATQQTWPAESIVDMIANQAQRQPDQTAVRCGDEQLSYAQLEQQSNAIAAHLSSLGVQPGSLVGLCVERAPAMVSWLVGILKAGAAYLPIDPEFPVDRQNYIAKDSGITVLVTQPHLRPTFEADFQGRILHAESAIPAAPKGWTRPTPAPEAMAYVIYTSGSTGQPKGVVIPHSAMKNFLLSMRETPGLGAADRLLAITTLSFDISVLEIFLPLIVGAELVIATRQQAIDGLALRQLLDESRATVMQGTPASWQLLIDAGWEGSPKLKMLCGGEALPRELADELLARGQELWNMYGPTETTVWSTVAQIERGEPHICIGAPIANTQLYILDDRRQPLPIGVPGNLFIGGAGLASGYYHRPELTAEKFVADPFQPGCRMYDTGDVARRNADGGMEILGRRDHQVKIRGYRIELGEIEHVLLQHAQVAQAVVVAKSIATTAGSRSESRLVAYLIAAGDARPTASELREFLRGTLPDYMLPSHFVYLDSFPQTPNRKVDRRQLPDPVVDATHESSAGVRSARDDLEQQLINLWKSILSLPQVGLDQDFFELGGHSLAAARMMVELEKIQGRRLPLAWLLQAPTIEKLAEVIRQQGYQPTWQSLVPISPGGSQTPLYCIHAAGGNVLLYRDLAKHLGSDRPIYGLQSDALQSDVPKAKTVEEMAAAYVTEIRKMQPSGPYHLCGYCLGGTIAYEVAQQLRAAGASVGVVALFDTHSRWVRGRWSARFYANFQQIWFHVENFILSGRRGRRAFVGEKLQEAKRRFSRRMAARFTSLTHRLGLRTEPPVVLLEGIYDRVTEDYVPQPYSGQLTVFKPRKAYVGYEDPNLGWGELVDELEIIDLPVSPAGMLLEPFVASLAQQLKSRL